MPDVAFTGTALSVLSDDASVRYTLGPLTRFSRNSGKKTVSFDWILMPGGRGNLLVDAAFTNNECCHFLMSHDAFVYLISGIIIKTEGRGRANGLWRSNVVLYPLDEQAE